MATEKQAKMLAARSKAAGIPYDFEALLKLENGDVDKKLAEIAAKTEIRQAVESVKEAPKQTIDKIRFGLAAKLVVQQYNLDWCIQAPVAFTEKVKSLYDVLMLAEAGISSST